MFRLQFVASLKLCYVRLSLRPKKKTRKQKSSPSTPVRPTHVTANQLVRVIQSKKKQPRLQTKRVPAKTLDFHAHQHPVPAGDIQVTGPVVQSGHFEAHPL